MSAKQILIIAAHPDDEVLGCGGTIKKLTKEGHKVFIFWLAAGRPPRTFGEQTEQEKVKHEVLDILGAQEVVIEAEALEDNEFDKVSLLNIIQRVEVAIEFVKPNIIFSHTEKCLNIDHQITAKAIKTAIARRLEIKEVYAFEVLSSTEWNYNNIFQPNYFVDIEETLEDKVMALSCYKSELKEFPHPRSVFGVEILSQYRGMQSGLIAAEAFEILLRKTSN